MLDKREEFSTKFAQLFKLIPLHTTRDCLTYDMTNYPKEVKNLLNYIIDDVLLRLQ